MAHLEAQQGLSLAVEGKSDIFVGTGNTGKLYTLGPQEKHEYASDVLDAGAYARFGRIEVQPGSNGYEIMTRSGNVEQPVRGWSDWEPLQGGRDRVACGTLPAVESHSASGRRPRRGGGELSTGERRPGLDEIVVVPGARLNPQNQPNPQQQTVTINFPNPNQGNGYNLRGPGQQPHHRHEGQIGDHRAMGRAR